VVLRQIKRVPVPGWRWGVVFAAVAVLGCLPALASALPVSVPDISAAQLEQRILSSQTMSFAGYAESDATFGLPPLTAFSSVTPLLDGVTRMRVWQASPSHWRVDTLSDAGEDDTYQVGREEYTWDSGEQLLTAILGAQPVRLPRAADLVPSALAVRIIQEVGPDARLSLLPPQRVAGQSAAGLAITPASPESTIGRVDIWAAPGTGLPLQVDVFGHGSTRPALETQFLEVGAWQPDESVLTPQRGPGTGFTSSAPGNLSEVLNTLDDEVLPASLGGIARQPSPSGFGEIGVYGGGLQDFAVLTFRRGTGFQLLQDALSDGATQLKNAHGFGAVASAPLVNIVIMHSFVSHDTYLLVGLVSKDALEQAAVTLAAKPDQDYDHNP
jgi:hypothetical protein